MELHALHPLSLPSLPHDALVVVGVGAALLVGLVFLNLGVLLPGLLTTLGGHHGDARGEYPEFGPVAAPTISEPAPRRGAQPQMLPSPHPPARPHTWHFLSGGMVLDLAPPRNAVTR